MLPRTTRLSYIRLLASVLFSTSAGSRYFGREATACGCCECEYGAACIAPRHLGSLPLRETTIRASVPAYPPVQRTTLQKLKKLIHEMFPAARPNQSTYGYSYYTVSMSDLPLGSAERVLKARPCRSGRTHTD